MTAQEAMKAKLTELGIPSKKIEVYGSQVVVTCVARTTACKWVSVLNRVCGREKVKCIETVDEVEKKTCLVSRYQHVYRVYGRI